MHAKATAGMRQLTPDLRWCVGALAAMSLIFVGPGWAEPDATAPPEEAALIELFEHVSPAVHD